MRTGDRKVQPVYERKTSSLYVVRKMLKSS